MPAQSVSISGVQNESSSVALIWDEDGAAVIAGEMSVVGWADGEISAGEAGGGDDSGGGDMLDSFVASGSVVAVETGLELEVAFASPELPGRT
jgi:hypothetical protein